MDGKKLFRTTAGMVPRGVLAAGDANENDLALGPIREAFVGPTLEADVSVRLRYHGLTESKWWATVKEKREEEHAPILAVDGIEEESNRREEARGWNVKSLHSKDSSKSSDETIVVSCDNSTNAFTPCKITGEKQIMIYNLLNCLEKKQNSSKKN